MRLSEERAFERAAVAVVRLTKQLVEAGVPAGDALAAANEIRRDVLGKGVRADDDAPADDDEATGEEAA